MHPASSKSVPQRVGYILSRSMASLLRVPARALDIATNASTPMLSSVFRVSSVGRARDC